MKRIFVALFAVAALAVSSVAQKSMAWEGYLADKMCGSKWTGEKGEQRAIKHTKACALEEGCRASGYGLVTGGKYVKFTDDSEAKDADYLEKTTQESNIYVKVTGALEGDKIVVASIEKAEKAAGKSSTKEKMEKKGKGMMGSNEGGCSCDCKESKQAMKHGEKGTKDHECTGDCKDGKHAMKHGEKGHACGEDCMKKG
ncbi:MAG: hypothetical protein AABY75_09540 [Bacteroidota bacterium]